MKENIKVWRKRRMKRGKQLETGVVLIQTGRCTMTRVPAWLEEDSIFCLASDDRQAGERVTQE